MQTSFVRSTMLLLLLALLGIVVIQFFWIQNYFTESHKNFDSSVNIMLTRVATRFEQQESLVSFSLKMQNQQLLRVNNPVLDSIYSLIDNLKKSINQSVNKISGNDYEAMKEYLTLEATTKELEMMANKQLSQIQHISQWIVFEHRAQSIPLRERIMLSNLPAIIEQEKTMQNLNLSMEYAVYEASGQKIVFSTDGFFNDSSTGIYQIDLYSSPLMRESPILAVKFPDKTTFIMDSMKWLLIITFLLLGIILAIFYFTMLVLVKQSKLAKVKTDFINNMTHEFKTPIATINLATDALQNVLKNNNIPEGTFTSIIKQETHRMHRHIDQILQIAFLEKGEVVLSLETYNIVSLISESIKSFSLRVSEQNGNIEFYHQKPEIFCKIDKDHFVNAINNLFDNSLKYNDKKPLIKVEVEEKAKFVTISISDNGIGMNKETIRRIFEKFYRGQTGNIHKIKGFGLGLTYVKLVIEKMNGTINVSSILGNGSRFKITLPTYKD